LNLLRLTFGRQYNSVVQRQSSSDTTKKINFLGHCLVVGEQLSSSRPEDFLYMFGMDLIDFDVEKKYN
jgi:hypothetical protein